MRIGPRLLRWLTILSAFVAAPVCDASDEENATVSKDLARERDQITRIELKDGQTLLGWVVEQNADKVIIELPVGGRMTIDRQLIGSLRPEAKTRITDSGEIWMRDPIPDRYLLMPSGILLKQGDFYFTQAQLSVSTLTLGVTDFLTIVGGAVVPAWFVRDGFNFIGGVKTGFSITNLLHLAGGAEAFVIPGTSSTFGLLYGTATVGTANANASLAMGGPFATEKRCTLLAGGGCDNKVYLSDLVITVSGKLRLTRGFSLVTENWIISNWSVSHTAIYSPSTTYSAKAEFILSLAAHAFGEKWAVDIGALRFPGVEFPIPWLNFSYRWN
jgi:hypothetical protein